MKIATDSQILIIRKNFTDYKRNTSKFHFEVLRSV